MKNNIDAKPIIGIVLDSTVNSEKNRYSDFPWYALRQNHIKVIVANSGIPILIPHEISLIPQYLDLVSGVIVPGSDEDINPKFYHQEIRSSKVKTNDSRASFELELVKNVLARKMPYLGICNGMQILNIALGGNLIQDIPEFYSTNINHEQPPPKNIPTHDITILESTKLRQLTGNQNLKVMSTHHQAIENLGQNLIISAVAPDGIIEAIELKDYDFAIGVEWHPEYESTQPLDSNIFKEFIRHASIFSKSNLDKNN